MTRNKILLVCVPFAAAGLALSLHGTFRVNRLERPAKAPASPSSSASASGGSS
jgi:hypothetical protein